jgi:hypothetical protein
MGTTSNYSWPTPEATDLVKDGWDAIKDLGDAADTTVKAVSDAQGLVHINTTDFTSVSSQSFNNVFTSAYQNYKVIARFANSTTATINLRLRASGSDNSTSNYYTSMIGRDNTSTRTINTGPATSIQLTENLAASAKGFELNFINPAAIALTLVFGSNINTAFNTFYTGGHQFTLTNSFDGFTIYPSAGNISGRIQIFGIKD